MDLLPVPREPAYEVMEVPVLVGKPLRYKYDYQGFTDYPRRCGWDSSQILRGDFRGRDPQDVRAFLQSWLYFGAAAEMLVGYNGKHLLPDIENALIFESASGAQILQNQPLRQAAESFKEDVELLLTLRERRLIRPETVATQMVEEHKKASLQRIDGILDDMRIYLNYIKDVKIEATDVPILPPVVVLSIAVLGDLFAVMRNSLFVWEQAYQNQRPSGESSEGRSMRDWENLMGYGMAQQIGSDGTEKMISWGELPLLRQRQLEQGWCPSDLTLLDRAAQMPSQIFISNMKRYRHGIQHEACTETRCHAYDVDQNYIHDHRTECDGSISCDLFKMAWADIESIVDEGNIPVLVSDPNEPNGIAVRSHSALGHEGFVAISHVWSDGLGNPKETALYRCQLSYIQELVSTLLDMAAGCNVPFWLDTLCIPLGPPAIRHRAIESMATVYAEASHVLVLDAELQNVPNDVHFTEALFRIALSGWNTRLWTLQEGVLAKNLSFQFKDKVRSIDSLYEEVIASQIGPQKQESAFENGPILQDSMNLNLVHTTISRSTGSKRLTGLAQALQRRSCMVPSDETICLATMLHLDLKRVLEIPETQFEDRMAYIWSSQKEIPRSVFKVSGSRLVEQGLPWAPRSLMGCETTMFNSRVTCVQQDDASLDMRCTAFVILCEDRKLTFPAILTPKTFGKDGLFILALPFPAGDEFHKEVKEPIILIPDINYVLWTPDGGRMIQGLLVSMSSLELMDGKVSVTYESDIYLQFFELQASSSDQQFSRPDTAFDIDIVIPPDDRRNASYFGNAFGFTDSTNNGMVREYTPSYLRFLSCRFTILLRYLSRMSDINTSDQDVKNAGVRLRTQMDMCSTKPFSLEEVRDALLTWTEVLFKICTACGQDTIYISTAVEHIKMYSARTEFTKLFQSILLPSMIQHPDSDNNPKLHDLVDERYRGLVKSTDWPDIRTKTLYMASSRSKETFFVEGEVDNDNNTDGESEEIARHRRLVWPKLLTAFLVDDLSRIKDLYPTEPQSFHLKYASSESSDQIGGSVWRDVPSHPDLVNESHQIPRNSNHFSNSSPSTSSRTGSSRRVSWGWGRLKKKMMQSRSG